jgi:type II secretory pathway component GspD/PulD (secretin)
MSTVNIKISPALKDARLVDVLNAITRVADQPIKYTIEDYAVVFSPKPAEAITLYSKTYHLDPNTFVKSLMAVTGINSGDSAPDTEKPTDGKPTDDDHDSLGGPASAGAQAGLNFVTLTNNTVALDTMVRNYFTMAGVDLTDPGKSVFFNDRLGLLLVRGTAEDLKLIEQAIGVLNQMPPQVMISSEFVELSRQECKTLGFGQFLQAKETNLTSVMSLSQYRVAIKAIRQNTHEDIISMPNVTTLSGRQAHIAAQDLQKIVIGTTTVALGPVLDVIPTVESDGYSINAILIPIYTEFLQDDPPGKFVPSSSGKQTGAPVAATSPLPHFRARQEVSTCNVRDSQTVIFGKLVSDKPSEPKRLHLFFVTPTIIDAVGNRVHTDEELYGKP